MNNNFKIVVPVYKSKWIGKCINSILSQDYKQFELIVIDDCSPDNTLEIIKSFKINYRSNKKREYALANVIEGYKTIAKDPEDILMVIDGDDWLSSQKVLSYLNEIYQDKNIWLTYGQFEPLSHTYHDYCKPLTNTCNYRKECVKGDWKTSQLRTYKKKIWDRIEQSDLKDKNGDYYQMAKDWAIMFPMIEMCGLKRIKFISKVLYIYNNLNSINDMKVNPTLQLAIGQEINNKPPYKEIIGGL